MTRAIPEQIVAAVTEVAESLAEWCEEGRDGRLEQQEAAVLGRVRQVLPTLLEAEVEAATSGLALRVRGQQAACPPCGRKARPNQERPRQVLTPCGAVTIECPWYTCSRCHHGWSVVETTLGVGRAASPAAALPSSPSAPGSAHGGPSPPDLNYRSESQLSVMISLD